MPTAEKPLNTPGGGDRATRVLVADRNAHYRETIRRVLDGCGDCSVVAEAATLPEAIAQAVERSPDLVLLDYDLVARENPAKLRRLAARFPDLRVVVLLSEYTQDYREAVQVKWGYLCIAKDQVEEQLTSIVGDARAARPRR